VVKLIFTDIKNKLFRIFSVLCGGLTKYTALEKKDLFLTSMRDAD